MTVRELINKLMDYPLEEEVNIAIEKVESEDLKIVYVGNGVITFKSPEQIGDDNTIYIQSNIKVENKVQTRAKGVN